MSKLVGRGIVKTYGKKTVLQDVNLMLEYPELYKKIVNEVDIIFEGKRRLEKYSHLG